MSTNSSYTPMISVSTVRRGGVAIVRVSGEVDMDSVEPMESAVHGELAHRPRALVVDLLDVRFCGSSALRVLISARSAAETARTGLCLVAAGKPVLRPLEIAGLTPLFTVHPSVPEALLSLTA
jgi:anti-sigma B factor antagonist